MKIRKKVFARIVTAAVFVILLLPTLARAQQSAAPKRVLVLYWYNKDFPGNVLFEQSFKAVLQSQSQPIEYYAEYLESNRFPGEAQSVVLRDYLRQKYADRTINAVVAVTDASLDFILKYRGDLFLHSPIVFIGIKRPTPEQLFTGPGMTGIVPVSTHRETIDLALRLHPDTEQVFVVSGTPELDKRFETSARKELQGYDTKVKISYLTDLSLNELITKTSTLPKRSIILYAWQQSLNEKGELLETWETLSAFAPTASAPIYGMGGVNVGYGLLGGYVSSSDTNGTRVAEITLKVLNGERAQDIPIESAPTVPMFDWRELRRWGISEQSLPLGSIVRFKQLTLWERYKWSILGVVALFLFQSLFIAVLLIERSRTHRARTALDQLNAELEERIAARTNALNNKSRELETFAYSVAHDLKAPLRGIDGYSRLLLEDHASELDPEGRSFLKTIHTSTEEMNQLIDDLLEYSRLERRELKLDRIEVSSLVSTVIQQVKREATDNHINFVVKVNGESIFSDANGIHQALRNYLDNAIKFTRKVPEPMIEIGSQETLKNVTLWVRDNGVGFDMKYHDRVFDIFQRLNPAEDYPGTGIGLAIVRKSMERIGGRAWAESQPGAGATFYLEIPKSFEGDLSDGQQSQSDSAR
jgi:signal transduction histidine kinase